MTNGFGGQVEWVELIYHPESVVARFAGIDPFGGPMLSPAGSAQWTAKLRSSLCEHTMVGTAGRIAARRHTCSSVIRWSPKCQPSPAARRPMLALVGPAFVAAVAYIDPGDFATNITAGARSGYTLVWVIVVANLMGMLVQYLSARLGVATGQDLPGEWFVKVLTLLDRVNWTASTGSRCRPGSNSTRAAGCAGARHRDARPHLRFVAEYFDRGPAKRIAAMPAPPR